jgi:putative phage-type endonuclease
MANTIIRPKDRTEWLALRTQGIGSSEVATIVGLNPWQTPYQLWRIKTGQDAPKPENFAMKAGHYLEDAVSMFWQDETGREVIKRSAGDWIIQSNDSPFMQVSPDRTFWLTGEKKNEDNKGILECKTTQFTIDGDDLPRHWFCQVQYQLGVAELQKGSLAWLTQGRQFGYKDIDFVPDFFAWLKDEVSRFWIDCVQGGKEPAIASLDDMLIKYRRHSPGSVVEVGDELLDAYHELKNLRADIAHLDERKEELETKLKLAFGEAEAIAYGGETLATFKAPKESMKFDTKAFTAAHPDLAAQFTKPTAGASRFLLK